MIAVPAKSRFNTKVSRLRSNTSYDVITFLSMFSTAILDPGSTELLNAAIAENNAVQQHLNGRNWSGLFAAFADTRLQNNRPSGLRFIVTINSVEQALNTVRTFFRLNASVPTVLRLYSFFVSPGSPAYQPNSGPWEALSATLFSTLVNFYRPTGTIIEQSSSTGFEWPQPRDIVLRTTNGARTNNIGGVRVQPLTV